jgi:hypothetical protein
MELVSDDYDSPFAGLAIKNSPSILLTYNKKHFNKDKLGRHGVKLFTPSELVKYLEIELKYGKKVKRKGGLLKLVSSLALLKRKN